MDRETALSLATQAIAQAGSCIVIKVQAPRHAWAFGPYVSAEDAAEIAETPAERTIVQPWYVKGE
jgi:hypothetical protein